MNKERQGYFENLREIQNNALRDPAQVICGNYELSGITPYSLQYTTNKTFLELLEKLKVTLLVTREYEHLILALYVVNGKLRQSFLHLPHPNGIAVNHNTQKVYVASTRNPNKIVELSVVKNLMDRSGYNRKHNGENYLTISREKYYAGAYYFHDLAFINRKLYANSVGKNGIVEINFNSSSSEKVVWSPLPSTLQNSNYLQLNSIAAGKKITESFFTASADKPGEYKPGDIRFPVDKKGVVFSGKTKKPVVRKLTRPHSAKLHKNKLWINNSGYGELGFVEKGIFKPVMKFPGWTRGLIFINDIAFVGVSKIIPKYSIYAPGLNPENQQCAVYAVDIKTKKIIGNIEWQMGNQIYGIEWVNSSHSIGFPFTGVHASGADEQDFYFRHDL